MEWLNYHHLHYFWVVAKEGGIGRAAEALHISQPTVSGQIKALEEALGVKLFRRAGRGIELTGEGRMIFGFADEIFTIGRELLSAVHGRPSGRPVKVRVGISDQLPKLIVHRILRPGLSLDQSVQFVCHGDKTERLMAELALQNLDLVISDVPVGGSIKVRAFNHLLGESGVSFFAAPKLAGGLPRRRFPSTLDGAPILLPTIESPLRRALDHWFTEISVEPRIVAEFDDSGLMKNFGEEGEGVFAAPTAVESAVCKQHGVKVIGRTDAVVERFYAITVERRIVNPAVVAIAKSAKKLLAGDA